MTDIHDIKPLLSIPAVWIGWILGLVLLLVLLAGMAFWMWRRRRTPAPQPLSQVLPNPHEEAFTQLDALAAEGAIGGKPFYFQLSAILRRYMERRFNIPAAEMTVEELLPEVDRLPLPVDLAGAIKSFCRAAEPVKFADAPADPGRMPRDLAFVRAFVQRTTLVESITGDQNVKVKSEERKVES